MGNFPRITLEKPFNMCEMWCQRRLVDLAEISLTYCACKSGHLIKRAWGLIRKVADATPCQSEFLLRTHNMDPFSDLLEQNIETVCTHPACKGCVYSTVWLQLSWCTWRTVCESCLKIICVYKLGCWLYQLKTVLLHHHRRNNFLLLDSLNNRLKTELKIMPEASVMNLFSNIIWQF